MPGSGPYSSHLGVAGPQKTSVVISFSMLGVHGSLAALVGEGGSAPPATGWARLWNSGVQHWQEKSPRIKARPSTQILSKPWGDFPFQNCWLFWLLFHWVQNLVQGEDVSLTGPLQKLRPLVYKLETLRKSEKGIQCWRRKQSQRFWGSGQRRKGAFLGPCLFFNLVVYSLDCAVWWVFIGGQVVFNIKRL